MPYYVALQCHIVLLVNLHGCAYHHGCACVRDVKRVWHLVGRSVDGSIMRNEAQYYFGNGSNISTPSLSPTHINYALIHSHACTCAWTCHVQPYRCVCLCETPGNHYVLIRYYTVMITHKCNNFGDS